MKKILNNKTAITITILFIIILVSTIFIKKYNLFYDTRTEKEFKNIIQINENEIQKNNSGKLVYLTGYLDYNENVLHDELFDVYVKSPRMIRYVEICQWIEYKNESDDKKIEYKYKKEWSSDIIDSSKYHDKNHSNPTKKKYKNKWFIQKKIRINNYTISNKVYNEIDNKMKLELKQNIKLPDGFKIYKSYYITNSIDPENPDVGDIRIVYYYSDWTLVTILAKQNNNILEKYITHNNEKTITIIPGKRDLSEIIDNYSFYVLK